MSDNKKKVGEPDRSLISRNEPYEWNYEIQKLHQEFPENTRQQIEQAIRESFDVNQPSENRIKIEKLARERLGAKRFFGERK